MYVNDFGLQSLCITQVMVQPQGPLGSVLQWDMAGREVVGSSSQESLETASQGSAGVPELADSEVVQRLMGDNQKLRGNQLCN